MFHNDNSDFLKLYKAFQEKKLEDVLNQNQFFNYTISQFVLDYADVLSAEEIKKIKSTLESQGAPLDLDELTKLNKKFTLALLKNFNNWQSVIPDQTKFLQYLCNNSSSGNAYVSQNKQLLKIKNKKEKEKKPVHPAKTENHQLNIQLIGGPDVGASSFLLQLAENKFYDKKIRPGYNLHNQSIKLGNHTANLQLWDSPSDRDNYNSYCHSVDVAIVLVDLTDEDSFDSLKESQMADILHAYKKIILVGTKSDLISDRKIDHDDILAYAKSKNLMYFETSAKTGKNINEVCDVAAKLALNFRLDCNNELPIANDLVGMNKDFESLYGIRQDDNCANKTYYTKQLEILRTTALEEIKNKARSMHDKSDKKSYLEDVLKLPIINKHNYIGMFASVKNIGHTDTYALIAGWVKELDKEIAHDNALAASNTTVSGPSGFKKIG